MQNYNDFVGGNLEIVNAHGTIVAHEVESGNYCVVTSSDEIEAEMCAQFFLDSLPDNDKFRYEVKSCDSDDEQDGLFYVTYNCYER